MTLIQAHKNVSVRVKGETYVLLEDMKFKMRAKSLDAVIMRLLKERKS